MEQMPQQQVIQQRVQNNKIKDKKIKVKKVKDKKTKNKNRLNVYKLFLAFTIIFGVGTLSTLTYFIINKNKENSIWFIELASKSVVEAYDFIKFNSKLGLVALICAVITVVLLIITIVIKIKDKKTLGKNQPMQPQYQQPTQQDNIQQ